MKKNIIKKYVVKIAKNYLLIYIFLSVILDILAYLRLKKFIFKFKFNNRHNYMTPLNIFNDEIVEIGVGSYGPLEVHSYGNVSEYLKIGNYCSIASNVKFILGGEHELLNLTTYPFLHYYFNKIEAICKGPIKLEDDVWIGTGAMILSGVTLRKGTVVAAGSVVVKSTNEYEIIGGVPAKFIRKRFTENVIEKIKQIDISRISLDDVGFDILYSKVNDDNVDLISSEIKRNYKI